MRPAGVRDGVNGYVWTFSTPTERYFLRRGRNKEVVDEALGESFGGVLVSDFYAAYHHYAGPKQRCWVHLLRDIHDLKALYPRDSRLLRWAAAVHSVYQQAKSFTHPDAGQRRRAQLGLERKLLARCRPFLTDPAAAQSKLCRRIEKFIKELFVFVAEPAVPADNNAAERSLRPLVISRKISGGTRSEGGTDSKMTLASLFGTWPRPGLEPPHLLPSIALFPSTLNCYKPDCPAAGRGSGCRGINLLPSARSQRRKKRSRERSVSTASPGRGWNPPGGWSTPRSLAPNAIPLSPGDGPSGPGRS